MKWFKHQSDASEDAFIEELEELFGLEGHARWFKMLEKIAIKMNETDTCFAEHSWVKWQSFLKGKRNKLELFLGHCQDKGKIKLEQNGNILKITCYKLLELRDNHTKNLQASSKETNQQLAPKIKSKELDIDKEFSSELVRTNSSESGALTKFQDLEFSEKFQEIAKASGLEGELATKTWLKFKAHYENKSPAEPIIAWKKWALNERKPPATASAEKPLEGDELLINLVGAANWKRSNGKFVDADAQRRLDKWESERGKVTWNHLEDWKSQQQINWQAL